MATEKDKFSKNGLKLGSDEGRVDGEWLKKAILENKVPSYIQIVDVTAPNEFKNGHIKGAINIEAAKLSAKELIEKLPKNQSIANLKLGLKRWLHAVESHYGVKPIIYSGESYYEDFLKEEFGDYLFWIANYNFYREKI